MAGCAPVYLTHLIYRSVWLLQKLPFGNIITKDAVKYIFYIFLLGDKDLPCTKKVHIKSSWFRWAHDLCGPSVKLCSCIDCMYSIML